MLSPSILFPAWEDCTGECAGASWTIGLTGGGGVVRDKLGQPRCWDTVGWTISCHPSFLGTSGCNETCGEMGYQGHVGDGKEAFLA
jgi:hypothetical protein